MFDITPFHAYADDNQITETNEKLKKLIENVQRTTEIQEVQQRSLNHLPGSMHCLALSKFIVKRYTWMLNYMITIKENYVSFKLTWAVCGVNLILILILSRLSISYFKRMSCTFNNSRK